ncbi:peptidoglycan-binding protein [Listeria monocytogenes]|nr:peptidoglycan-binding protein [Listeria monocytogenes]EAC4011208.1 peptidoglycan-binding protein [Listeria monocytogenes]EAD1240388.1 peptidoglycan-binding protein [Listeria monocytogenes]EAF6810316.1 peptidoglycan-binding protein [Listeria monocytogenes]EKY4198721.1 MucBP domain-containing protein [Listeria monocytogenes]
MSKNVKKIVITLFALIMTIGLASGFIAPIKASADTNNFTVKVEYVDADGAEIAPSDILTDYHYVSTPKDIPGYKLREIPHNATGNITDTGIIVRYIYDKTIDVRYVDETGKDLLPVVEIINSEAAVLETISDYTFVKKDISIDGLHIIFRYKKNISTIPDFGKPNQVTVNYLDENKTPIAPSLYLSGLFNEAYNVPMKKIKGYTILKYDSEILGVFTESPQTINIIYQKKAPEQSPSMEPLPDPTFPENPQVEKSKIETTEKRTTSKVKIAPKALKLTKVEQKKQETKDSLPKTGDSSVNLLITCLGIIAISCGVYLLVQQSQKRRRKE